MSAVVYEFFDEMNGALPFTLNHLSILSNDEPANVFMNWHSHPEIIFAFEGEGSVLCENELIPIKQGDIVFVNSEQYHDIITDKYLKFYYLIIYDDFLIQNGLDPVKTKFKNLVSDKKAAQLFMNIIKASETTAYYSNFESRCLVLLFMSELYKNHVADSNAKENDSINTVRIKEIIRYIKSHLAEKITLDQLCAEHNISKFYLSHEFKKHTGTSIIEYINAMRCMKAKTLIKSGCSVQDAATSSGFENLSYFSKTYKRIIGHLPSDDKNSK